jgi:hypothetical protein
MEGNRAKAIDFFILGYFQIHLVQRNHGGQIERA